MIVESHWRKLKHDFLHHFPRPRIDMVVWIMIIRLIPQILDRMEALKTGDRRRAVASWRKTLKQDRKKCKNQDVSPQSLSNYHTDPVKWTCGCEAFLLSRFLLCKHIVCCFEEIQKPVQFFSKIRRQRSDPFWVESQIILCPEFEASTNSVSINTVEGSGTDNISDFDDFEPREGPHEEDQLASLEDDEPEPPNISEFNTKIQLLMNRFNT